MLLDVASYLTNIFLNFYKIYTLKHLLPDFLIVYWCELLHRRSIVFVLKQTFKEGEWSKIAYWTIIIRFLLRQFWIIASGFFNVNSELSDNIDDLISSSLDY